MELAADMSNPHLSSSPLPTRPKMTIMELTYLAQHWQPTEDPPLYGSLMASSEVDQKFLGHFAKTTSNENNYLSSFLFRVLGLSVVLSEQLLRARRARHLDPVRDVNARHLVHHILWLAREGLVMVEQYILPMIENYIELKVLSYKLRASFYHIFVLFHNDPPVNNRVIRSRSASTSSAGVAGMYDLFPTPLVPRSTKSPARSSRDPIRSPSGRQRSPAISLGGAIGNSRASSTVNPKKPPTSAPPGLGVPTPFSTNPYSTITPSKMGLEYYSSSSKKSKFALDPSVATYLLPLADYTSHATAAFAAASAFADTLLPGSHPLRLSVKVEYVAYIYDCLKEPEVSRKMARGAIRHVYEATEPMDDESFEDAAEMVGILGKMMRRGLVGGPGNAGAGGGGGATTAATAAPTAISGPSTTNMPRSGNVSVTSGKSPSQSLSQSQSQSRSRNQSRKSSGTSFGEGSSNNNNTANTNQASGSSNGTTKQRALAAGKSARQSPSSTGRGGSSPLQGRSAQQSTRQNQHRPQPPGTWV